MSRRWAQRALVACLATTLLGGPGVAPARGQTAAPHKPQPATPPAPVVRVATRLVEVNVVVHGKKGNPVADVNRGDFVLRDEGKLQKVEFFSVYTNQPLSAVPPSLAPDTYSNRFALRSGVPTSVTVILLDGVNTRFEDQARAREQVIKFLGQLQPQDHVALYALGRNLNVLRDFTTDASGLLRALARYRGRHMPQLEASEPPDSDTGISHLDDFISGAQQEQAAFFMRNRVRLTLEALKAIANHLANLPGRKNLIWVSGSFPIYIGLDSLDLSGSPVEVYADLIEEMARALTNADVAVYPVDARGLIPPELGLVNRGSAPARPSANRRGLVIPPNPFPGPNRATFDTMNTVADRTGGRAFSNTSDILGSIRRAIDDSRVTYVLAYYPDHSRWDGKFHKIKVDLERKGAQVRARSGYFALPDPSPNPKQRQAVVADTVLSPLDATGIGLVARVGAVDVPGAQSLKVHLQLDAQEIRFLQKEGRWAADMDFIYALLDARGQILKVKDLTWQLRLLSPSYAAMLNAGMDYTQDVPVVPKANELRIVVRDAGTGTLGSLSIPIAK